MLDNSNNIAKENTVKTTICHKRISQDKKCLLSIYKLDICEFCNGKQIALVILLDLYKNLDKEGQLDMEFLFERLCKKPYIPIKSIDAILKRRI